MTRMRRAALCLAALGVVSVPAGTLRAQAAAPVAASGTDSGQHGFDFLMGSRWKVHLKRLLHPLTGSTTWVELDGWSQTHPLWDGRANVDEFVTRSGDGSMNVEGLTLRLYNGKTGEWSLYWGTSTLGALAMPPTVGKFADGRGEFYDHEDYQGKPIIVRYIWSDMSPTHAHFEQSFSADGGKTWEVNWISDQWREKP